MSVQDFGFHSHELRSPTRSSYRSDSTRISPIPSVSQGLLAPAFEILDATTERLLGHSNTDRSRVDSPTHILPPADERGPEITHSPHVAAPGPGCSPSGGVDGESMSKHPDANRASVSPKQVEASIRVQRVPSSRMATPPTTRRRYANLISPGKEARPVASGSGVVKSVFYRANLDELEVWANASVAPGVFAPPIYAKRSANASREREAMRCNLRAFMKTAEAHSDTTQPSHRGGPSQLNKTSRPVAVAAIPRTVRSQKIIEEIFGTEDSVIQSEVTSSSVSRRPSPALEASSTRTFGRPSTRPLINHPFTHSLSRTTSSFGKASRPAQLEQDELPFLENPPPIEAPPTPPRSGAACRTPSPSLSEANPLANFTFRIDPTNPLHQCPRRSGSPINGTQQPRSLGPVTLSPPLTSAPGVQNLPVHLDHTFDIASSSSSSLLFAFPRSVLPDISSHHVIQPTPATDSSEESSKIHEPPMGERDSPRAEPQTLPVDPRASPALSEQVTELVSSVVEHGPTDGPLNTSGHLQPDLLSHQSVVDQSQSNVSSSLSPSKSTDSPPTFASSVSSLLEHERSSTSIPMAPAVWNDVEPLSRERTTEGAPEIDQTHSVPVVLDRGYLQPRYRDLWAPDNDNAFLRQALHHMVIGQVRPGLEAWDSNGDDTEEDEPEEADIDELANDAESPGSDLEVRDPESGVVFLSQRISESSATPPNSALRMRTSLRIKEKGHQSPVTPRRKRMASQELVEGAGAPSSSKRIRTTSAAGSDQESETEGTEGFANSPINIGTRIQRWTALLQSFLKVKNRNGVGCPDVLELKKALLEIESDALFIAPTSPLAGYMYTFANLRPSEIPNDDKLGLRVLAKKFLQVWGREIPKPT